MSPKHTPDPAPESVLRPHAEHEFAHELAALAAADDRQRPPSWRLSPWAVVTYLLGGSLPDGTVISPKYVGQRRLIEIAVATLATDRALLLLGVPGTAKTWVSEHLAAAISGDSTLLVQGTAGTAEESLRYGWNYARLLAEGPSEAALVPSPVYRAMRAGSIVRVEELTRMPSDVQDALVTVLSEKTLPDARTGQRDPGGTGLQPHRHGQRPRPRHQRSVGRAAPALQHRRAAAAGRSRRRGRDRAATRRRDGVALRLPKVPAADEEIRRVVDGVPRAAQRRDRGRAGQPQGAQRSLSTAEAISVVTNGLALAAHFGDGQLNAADVAAGIVGAVVKDPVHDTVAWREYLEAVVRDRSGWGDFYEACREL